MLESLNPLQAFGCSGSRQSARGAVVAGSGGFIMPHPAGASSQVLQMLNTLQSPAGHVPACLPVSRRKRPRWQDQLSACL